MNDLPNSPASSADKLIVWKNAGETLDQLLDRVRSDSSADKLGYNISPETKMTYAGRLDPLASGIMILLVGDGVHDKELYNKLDKRYRATVVLGFETDTYDVLGIPSPLQEKVASRPDEVLQNNLTPTLSWQGEGVTKILQSQIGTHTQSYPPYSAKNVNGVPLWKLTRDGNLPEVLPSREVVVHDAQLALQEPSPRSGEGDTRSVAGEDLLKEIQNIVSRVPGDFRQEEILASWEKNIVSRETYQILEIDYHVGSGTYIRGLVHELGQQLGTGAVLLGLERYQVGNYGKSDIL